MANALSLTASSTGRAPVPTGDGSTLLVDDANAVMITVAPNPSSWDPEGLALFRGGQRVATPPMSDGTRWVLMGDDRFGSFQARATAAGTPVESPAIRVVPATVSLRATPGGATSGTSPVGASPGTAPASVAPASVAPPVVAPPVVAPASVAPPSGAQPVAAPSTGIAPATSRATPASPAPMASPSLASPVSPASLPPAPSLTRPQPSAPAAPISAAAAPHSPSTQGVVEVPLGEYDGRFAAVVAAIFALLAVIVLAIVATQVISDLIIATPIPTDSPTPDADSAARSARATSALLIAVGMILLLAAAALAALDVRGRQRRNSATPTALRGTQATLDKAPGILENPGKFRGTLALLITGVVVVLIGFLGQVHWG